MSVAFSLSIPLPDVGSVNAWLLPGEPLTLIDTGPCSDAALGALERALATHGVRVEDIELVLGTHHHHDHVGLAATIKRRSGARIAALAATAAYGAALEQRVAGDRAFSHALMCDHGVPGDLRGRGDAMWDYIAATAERFDADVLLHDGDTIAAGSRTLRVIARPGHSATDTLLVDDADRSAFVGDHLLADITANSEVTAAPAAARTRPRLAQRAGLRRTAQLPLRRLRTGHGPEVTDHRALIARQLAGDRRRCARVQTIVDDAGPSTAFAIAARLWSDDVVRAQPLLVIWEVLGVLDLLLADGRIAERPGDDGRVIYTRPGGDHV